MHNKNAGTNGTYRKGQLELCIQTAMLLTIVVTCNSTNKSCNNAFNSYHLQLLHTKVVIWNCCNCCTILQFSSFFDRSSINFLLMVHGFWLPLPTKSFPISDLIKLILPLWFCSILQTWYMNFQQWCSVCFVEPLSICQLV